MAILRKEIKEGTLRSETTGEDALDSVKVDDEEPEVPPPPTPTVTRTKNRSAARPKVRSGEPACGYEHEQDDSCGNDPNHKTNNPRNSSP